MKITKILQKLLKMFTRKLTPKAHIGKKDLLNNSFIPSSEVKKEDKGKRIYKKKQVKKSVQKVKGRQVFTFTHRSRLIDMSFVASTDRSILSYGDNRLINPMREQEIQDKPSVRTKEKKQPSIIVESNPVYEMYNKKVSFRRYEGINSYRERIYIVGYPTDNCQLSSIGSAQNLIYVLKEDKEELILYLKEHTKRQILIDIKLDYETSVINFLEPYTEIVIKNEYISTNGSNMIIYILKWKEEELPF